MHALKTLLVHLDGTRAAARRLEFAVALAKQHGARLEAVFAVAPRFLPLPLPTPEGVPPAPLLQEVDARHRRHAHALYLRVCADAPDVRWIDLSGPDVVGRFVRRARLADCVVLGQADPQDPAAADVPAHWTEAVLLDVGVPALVVPTLGTAHASPDTVLVAWKSSPQSARALARALPVLVAAREVHLAVAAGPGLQAEEDRDAVAGYLAEHGVGGVRFQCTVPEGGAGDAILSLASDTGAGLLVMGCYGHSRAREWILGGASRTVISSMTLPVWMAH